MQQEAAMFPVIQSDAIALAARSIYRIEDGAGLRIECLCGALWVTQAADHRDITLERGETFELDRDGLAVIYGLEPARFRLAVEPQQARPIAAATAKRAA